MEDNKSWKGVHVSRLQTSLNLSQFPGLISNEEHTIRFRIPLQVGKVPECFPSIFNKRDFWDGYHVKLPCSEKNVTRDHVSRWVLIRNALSSQISSSWHLQATILNYNTRYADQWNFSALHSLFEEVLDEMETAVFFETLLPKIIDLALRLPELITGGIPLLKRGYRHSVSLSQLQISCLLANAFLCTFPHRNSAKKDAEYFDYPDINFSRLFQCDYDARIKSVQGKIKCLLNYFRRVTCKGVVTYSRQFVSNNLYPSWSSSNKQLPRLYVSSEGTIEDDGFGLLQVDFANKFVGGGVIGTGCVQEEIRFVICPELILSRLFTQCLGENEALVITGCERFNKYKGYGSSFEWDGDYVDGTPSDKYGRKYCTVIALDALYYMQNPQDQYLMKNILRDINKAYVGFSWGSHRNKEDLCAVATGNWGCGAFRGDPELKSFLQLMAAGEVGRDLAYFTFGDVKLRDEMAAAHQFLVENEVTIGKLYSLLNEYNDKNMFETVGLFKFFRNEALKKTDVIEMECDTSKSNASNGLPRFEITKSSFCYRTKVSDWFRPVSKTKLSENDNEVSKLDVAHAESQKQNLINIYQLSSSESYSVSETQSAEDDCFEFLNKFKMSLKKPRKSSVKIDEDSHAGDADENSNQVIIDKSDTVSESNGDSATDTKDSFSNHNLAEEKTNSMSENTNSISNSELRECEENLKAGKDSLVVDDQLNEVVQPRNSKADSKFLNDSSDMNSFIEDNGNNGRSAVPWLETKEFEKENINANCDETPPFILSNRMKQSSSSKKTANRLLSKRFPAKRLSVTSNSNFRARKISDYFSPKTV